MEQYIIFAIILFVFTVVAYKTGKDNEYDRAREEKRTEDIEQYKRRRESMLDEAYNKAYENHRAISDIQDVLSDKGLAEFSELGTLIPKTKGKK